MNKILFSSIYIFKIHNTFFYFGLDIDRDEYYGSLPEYLLTQKGQSYVKDIKFNRLPTVDYNITVNISSSIT